MNVVNEREDLAMARNLLRGIVIDVVCARSTDAGEDVVQDLEAS